MPKPPEFLPKVDEAQWMRMDARERALQIAADLCDRIKVKEEGGSNRGEWVERILSTTGLPGGNAWCAAFVTYCNLKAGLMPMPTEGRARVYSWYLWAKRNGRLTEKPERGDLGLWINPDTTGHIFRVVKVAGPLISTIEGNTGPDSGRDGDGTYRKVRLRTSKLKFISMRP